MTHRRAVAALFAFTLVAAGCGIDDGGTGAAGAFSIEGALAELPLDEEPGAVISIGDLARATELAGLERPGADDGDAIAEWAQRLSGVRREEQDLVLVLFPELLRNSVGSSEEVADELGWNVADVDAYAEVYRPPHHTAVVSGADLDAAVFDDGDVVELEDGIVTAGEGEDHWTDFDGRTALRPLGIPLRMGAADGRIVASRSTDVVRGWLDGGLRSSADSEPHRLVAAALDRADAYGAMLVSYRGTDAPSGRGGPALTAAVDVVGIGWSVVDDEAVMTIVHHFVDEDAAAEQVANIEEIFRDGRTVAGDQPLAEVLELDGVVADGALTVTTVRRAGAGTLMTPLNLMMQREPPFAFD